MWGGLGDRLAGLGDAISHQASAHAKKQHERGGQRAAPPAADAAAGAADDTAAAADAQPLQAVLGSFRTWGSTLVESTKSIVHETQRTLEKEQARIQANAPSLFAKSGPYKRDPGLPLDTEALRDAEVVYVTDRILTLSHPFQQSASDGDITPERKLAAVGHLLHKRHGGKYMLWNLSEVEYDASVLDDQVLVYKFPGSPSPPLGLLLKLLMSLESWLRADAENVAVLHCLTGRGRTSTVLAAFLCWTGEAGFTDVNGALEYIARCKRVSVAHLTIPSQVRYAGYFANMLDAVRPSQPPLMLKRIIMSAAPKFGKRPAPPPGDGADEAAASDTLFGCAPYLQIFKAGSLIFTTAASVNYAQSKDDLPFCTTADGPVSFLTEAVVQGDILLRCRHLTKSGQRVSMFRCAFHTGYVPPKVMRLTKAQLDGACGDRRFADDFFLDFIFEPCDEATASQHLMETPKKGSDESEKVGEEEAPANEAAERRSLGTVGNVSNTVSASAYDSMLHRDSRFWDVIGQRREENMQKQAALENMSGDEKDAEVKKNENTPLSGPTIGRRRDFASKEAHGGATDTQEDGKGTGASAKAKTQHDRMNAFSIGDEFGPGPSKPLEIPSTPQPKEKDALMEALMDLDDDGLEDEEGEVVFETDDDDSPAEETAVVEVPSLPTQLPAATETNSHENASQADSAVVASSEVSSTGQEARATPDADEITPDDKVVDIPTVVTSGVLETSEEDTDLSSDVAGLGDDLHNLDMGDGDEGFDDEFDDFEDDAELEDLENFLTKVSST